MINEAYDPSSDSFSDDEFADSLSVSFSSEEGSKRNAECQTESSPVILRSWKIQRASPVSAQLSGAWGNNENHGSLLPDGTEIYVHETQAVGFSVSTQTSDSVIFRRTRAEINEILTSWRVLTILLPSSLYLILFFSDQLLDIIVCSEFCSDKDTWWCAFGLLFLLGPSLFMSIFAYEQLIEPDVPSIKPLNKNIGRVLCILQMTPYYIIGRRMWWGLKAWSFSDHREDQLRRSAQRLWEKAALEEDSTTIKLFQSLFESAPQLSLQSYVLIKKTSENALLGEEGPTAALWVSVVVNLLSASSGMASSQSQSMFERFAGTLAVFTTLGSRTIICAGVATIHPALWLVPIFASFIIGVVTKFSESTESTLSGHLHKFKNYLLEAFVMASACPPFNPTGYFCSLVYTLAAIVLFVQNPSKLLNISAIVLATIGQVIWVSIGFCLMNNPKSETTSVISNTRNPA